jgi:integrase
MKLTTKSVAKLLRKGMPGKRTDTGGLDSVRGLMLEVTGRFTGNWQLRYALNGVERYMGLGSAKDFSLTEARARARQARQKLSDGVDPLAVRQAERAAQAAASAKRITFAEAAQRYIEQHRDAWRNAKHGQQWTNTLRDYAFPVLGSMDVADVDTAAVLRAIEPIWKDRTETAARVRQRIESIIDWAAVRGFRPRGDNPARWKGHLSEVLPARDKIARQQHHAAMPYRDLPAFIAELRQRDGVAARALEFCILTAARTGEVVGAHWSEIDLSTRTWTVPPGRIKGGREHRVPLSDRALAILEALPREADNEFCFIGPRTAGLTDMALAKALKRMNRTETVTVHGFRSSFMDWAHEQSAFAKVVIDQSLAHVVSDKVEAACRRGDLFDKRRKLMQAWGTYCSTPPSRQAANVVSLGGR